MNILLNPGPVVLSKRVREALLKPDLCHREIEFVELQNNIRNNLLGVYKLSSEKWASVIFTGSGTSAMESMITSLVPIHGKLLVIENGVYGERLTKIAKIHNIDHVVLHHEWEEEINLSNLNNELQYHKEISHVAVVHHETTTGRLNDIAEIANICKKHKNVSLLVDAVSSFGAEELKFDEWNIAACASTANKCLHGVPGVSFVITSRNAISPMAATPARTLYLNLIGYLNAQDNDKTPFTQSIQTFYGLDEALEELTELGGWENRQKKYQSLMNLVRLEFENLKIKPCLGQGKSSCVLNSFYLPEGVSYQKLHDELKKDGFIIYAGQGGLKKSFFRISCMGDISEDDIKRFISAIKKIVKN